jgi:hypothetical protein
VRAATGCLSVRVGRLMTVTWPVTWQVPKGFVVAFEPQRVVNQILCSNIQVREGRDVSD